MVGDKKAKHFITVSHGLTSFFATHMWFNEEDLEGEGFWEPYESGFGRYATREQAEEEAKQWALDWELEFKP